MYDTFEIAILKILADSPKIDEFRVAGSNDSFIIWPYDVQKYLPDYIPGCVPDDGTYSKICITLQKYLDRRIVSPYGDNAVTVNLRQLQRIREIVGGSV